VGGVVKLTLFVHPAADIRAFGYLPVHDYGPRVEVERADQLRQIRFSYVPVEVDVQHAAGPPKAGELRL